MWAEYTESVAIPVLASALRFCSALVVQKHQDQQRVLASFGFVEPWLEASEPDCLTLLFSDAFSAHGQSSEMAVCRIEIEAVGECNL